MSLAGLGHGRAAAPRRAHWRIKDRSLMNDWWLIQK